MPDYEPGTVTRMGCYVFVCALGNHEEDVAAPTMRDAERMARRAGWSKTVKHGWICPACREKFRAARKRIREESE